MEKISFSFLLDPTDLEAEISTEVEFVKWRDLSSLDRSISDSAKRWSGLRWFRNERSPPPTPIRIPDGLRQIALLRGLTFIPSSS